jgi:hypothetical protein
MSSASEMAAEVVVGVVVTVVVIARVVGGTGIELLRETSDTVSPATAIAPARP